MDSGTNSRCSSICSIFAFFITHYNKFVQSMQNCQNNTHSYINRLFVKCIELLQHPTVYCLTLVQICGVEDQWDSIRSATCALLRRWNFFKQFGYHPHSYWCNIPKSNQKNQMQKIGRIREFSFEVEWSIQLEPIFDIGWGIEPFES